MPVQTRRRGPKAAPAHKEVSEAQPVVKKTAETHVPAKRAAPKAAKPAPSPKRSTQSKKASSGQPSEVFQEVLSQIQHLGPTRIQKNLTTRKQRSRSKVAGKQATERLVKRQALSLELHRLSNPDLLSSDKTQVPKEIKARVEAEEKRREAGESIKRRALLKEIKTKGEKGLHAILHHPRAGKSRSTSPVRRVSSADPKQLKGKTMSELTELVSPRTAFHPSIVKQKLQIKDTHKQVGLEMMKHAQVQEIKQRGGNRGGRGARK